MGGSIFSQKYMLHLHLLQTQKFKPDNCRYDDRCYYSQTKRPRVPHCSSGQGANGTTDQGTTAGNQKATFKTLVSEDT